MDVKYFSVNTNNAIGAVSFVEVGSGEWVKREDHSAFVAELQEQVRALAAENALLEPGSTYFSYSCDAGYEEHDSAEKARASAEADIDYYRGDACDGWPEDVVSVTWGVVIEAATQTGLRTRTDEDSCDSSITEVCDYVLVPAIRAGEQP